VGYSAEGEITTEETYLNQGRLVEKDVVADYSNHPSIRKVVEVVESRFFSVSPLHLAYFLGLVYYKQMHSFYSTLNKVLLQFFRPDVCVTMPTLMQVFLWVRQQKALCWSQA
jgi:hypothetical protein